MQSPLRDHINVHIYDVIFQIWMVQNLQNNLNFTKMLPYRRSNIRGVNVFFKLTFELD
jgi:hypothetical protein